MTRPAIGKARRLAIGRIVTALRTKYADVLSAAVAAGPVPALHMPAPVREAVIAGDPDDPEEMVRNHPVVIAVIPSGSRRVLQDASGGPSTYSTTTEMEVTCLLTFQAAIPSRALDADGVALTQDAELQLRAELYTEALVTCVLTYACQTGVIHQVRLERDESRGNFLNDKQGGAGILGVAAASFTLTQRCDVPQRVESLS